jgi:hypothetical protein
MKKFLTICICLVFFQSLKSQSYLGYGIDNYSGIHGVLFNPSSVVNTRLRADINFVSGSVLAGNDYFNLDFKSIRNGEATFDFDSGIGRFATNQNNFLFNLDVVGPSFMFNLSPKHSIAVITRGRAILNLNNINGELYEAFEDGFDVSKSFQADMENFNGNLHGWAEFGLSYGRVLINNQSHKLNGGMTLKYLKGAGGMFFNSNTLNGNYNVDSGSLTTEGELVYGSSQDFNEEDFSLSNTGSGLGFDLGLTYEYKRPKLVDDNSSPNGYKFKAAVALVDLGSISYNDAKINTYDLNRTVDTNDFKDADFETLLMNNYEGVEESTKGKLRLPTATNILLDYQVRKRLYIALHSSLSLISSDKLQANKILNAVTVLPRLETKWLGLGIPISYRQYDNITVGTNFRLGPLFAGSGSVLSNLFSDSTTSADVYAGIKLPLYKKYKP